MEQFTPVRVRTIRQHIGPDGQKWQGDEYERTREDAEKLASMGVVEIVQAEQAKPKPKRKSAKAID